MIKELLLGAMLALSPAANASGITGPSSVTADQAQELQLIAYHAWREACEAKDMVAFCNTVRQPLIGYALMPGKFGMYPIGSGVLFINLEIIGQPFSFVVMVHEMVHVLQDHDNKERTECEDEAEAFRLAFNASLIYEIEDKRIYTWTEAKGMYGCK